MDSATISHSIIEWIKHTLATIGLPEKWLDKAEPVILIIIITIISLIIAEVLYRLGRLALKRFLRLRSYTFLIKIVEHNALRKLTHIVPPLIILTILPLTFVDTPLLQHYVERIAWIYFTLMLTGAANSFITVVGETIFNNSRYHNRPIKGFVQVEYINSPPALRYFADAESIGY